MTRTGLAALASLALWPAAAGAAVFDLTITSVSGTTHGPVVAGTPELTITDAALAAGTVFFSEAGRGSPLPYADPSSGFVSFTDGTGLVLANPDTDPYTVTGSTLVSLALGGGTITSGRIEINNGSTEYDLTLGGGTFTGLYGVDGPSGCDGAPCTISGTYADPPAVAVPEAPGLALLLMGMAGIGLATVPARRRARRGVADA